MDMKKLIISVLIIASLILILFLFFNSTRPITGEAIVNRHTFTKAICNETNYCEDYEIACENNEIKKITATGFAVQQPKNWKDPRNEEARNRECG